MRQRQGKIERSMSNVSTASDEDEAGDIAPPAGDAAPPKDKKKTRQTFFVRMWMTFFMIGLFFLIMSLGHSVVVAEIYILQIFTFRELLNVRYNHAKEREIPWFRSLHWSVFCVASFYSNGVAVLEHLGRYGLPMAATAVRYHTVLSFAGYAAVFIAIVLSLRKGYYRYQMGQVTWTCLILAIVVFQTRAIVFNIYEGFFWFVFPASLVVNNDCFAYFSGLAFGRKYIRTPFLKLSPNKTWEGFIGAFAATVVFGFFFCLVLAHFSIFTCPYGEPSCVPNPIFVSEPYPLPAFFVAPQAALFGSPVLTTVPIAPIQWHSLFFSFVASCIAPFGGFFASGIKRAYNIKDFDSVIPGHGGFMDRLDCQLIMGLYTYVHYQSFVKLPESPLSMLLATLSVMPPDAQVQVLRKLLSLLVDGAMLPQTAADAVLAALQA